MQVSIIIPAYKQEKTIVKDVKNICKVMEETRWKYEVIVVVDGFVDKTYLNAKKVKHSGVKITGYKENKGKGYAIRYGMARSKGEIVLFIDAGMDISANSISMLLEHMEWYDAEIIVGSKRHPVSKVNYPLLRRIYSWGYFTIVKFLFGLKITDTQTGIKAFRREVLNAVLPRLVVKKFAFDIEILAVARHLGFVRIYEAPIIVNWNIKSTSFNKFLFLEPYIRNMLIDTLAIFYRLRILRYYDNENKSNWLFDKNLQIKVRKRIAG